MDIKEILDKILHAAYGRDVRQSLHDGVKMAVETADETEKAQVKLNGKFEAQIKNMTLESPSDAEIVAARMNAGGTAYDTLGKRLDAMDTNSDTIHQDSSKALEIARSGGALRVKRISCKVSQSGYVIYLVKSEDFPSVTIGGETCSTVPVGIVGYSFQGQEGYDLKSIRLEDYLPTKGANARIGYHVAKSEDAPSSATLDIDVLFRAVF